MMCFGLKERKRTKTNHCVIVLLDDTQLVHELHASSTGQDLLDVVIKHLNLLETSYFGLRYLEDPARPSDGHPHTSHRVEQVWLDVNKSAIKQLKEVSPMTVYFGVKYYASDPCKLAEEITRYQFFLQCKQDILHARLPVSFELAVELFALAVQSELGDYDPQRHHPGYVSEFQFLANQSAELEKRVAACHRTLTGQVPATAELNFLERVKWLDLYGCELHPIQYEDNGDQYALGLNPSGVLVLRNKLKVAHYHWPRIVKTKCQGRCFLMDVIDAGKPGASGQPDRNRFGFRLADKSASRRLRWAIDEHKSFYHLLAHSATLNQLAHRQLQQQLQQQHQLKLSQRFRNSIRSAINVSQFPTSNHQQGSSQHKTLRSSMKSTGNNPNDQYVPDSRAPPRVVRMPSRRLSNRSLGGLPYGQLPGKLAMAANGNGLPSVTQGGPHTMVESQRQQAIMMMNQFNHMNSMAGKSQTLKPMPVSAKLDSKEAKKNPYYEMMMLMMANSQHQEVAVLAPGRHIVQPSIYKSSSVVNGLNQLGNSKQEAASKRAMNMMQLLNMGGPYGYQPVSGHESPRSTKSAIAPSSALKLVGKKLAKQHQQFIYANQRADAQPLLAAYESANQQHHHQGYAPDYYGTVNMSNSANPSPRSVRSSRMAGRHKSKSINENLHLLHSAKYLDHPAVDKILLAKGAQLLPPPGYQSSQNNQNEQLNKRANRKRTTFALDNEQARLLLSMDPQRAQQALMSRNRGQQDEQYCCSRSDCSSADETGSRQPENQQRNRRPARQPPISDKAQMVDEQQQWNAIRKRHNEFSNGKGYLVNGTSYTSQSMEDSNRKSMFGQDELDDNNNPESKLVKNIANKQATPILLSMNYEQSNANNKAVQLLNLQRQQLNSQSSDMGSKSLSSGADSGGSSVASSPKAQEDPKQPTQQAGNQAPKTSDSTTSSSTTSGYYAGSNSTEDSDTPTPGKDASKGQGNGGNKYGSPLGQWPSGQQDDSSRAKIALGSYASRMAGNRLLIGNQANYKQRPQRAQQQMGQQFYLDESSTDAYQQDDSNGNMNNTLSDGQQWSPLNQIQQHPPSSLKYVSFDV